MILPNWVIIVSIVLLALLLFTTINLFIKQTKSEQLILSQYNVIDRIKTAIDASNSRLKEIDEKGMFESDDEIGWFFNEVKTIQNELNQFNPVQEDDQTQIPNEQR